MVFTLEVNTENDGGTYKTKNTLEVNTENDGVIKICLIIYSVIP